MKNIHIFLPFEQKNIKIAEITRGGVCAILLSRDSLKDIVSLKENLNDYKLDSLTTAGIYFLIGENSELDDILDVYIGKAEDCLSRILQHNSEDEKDFQKIICITSNKGDYNFGHATYLEHNLTNIAKEAKRCNLINGNIPPTTKISPEIKADLELDIASIKTLIEVFNLNILIPKKVRKTLENSNELTSEEEKQVFYCRSGKGADSLAIYNEHEGKMLVLKGSKVRKGNTNSYSEVYVKLRQKLIDEKILSDHEDHYLFDEDYEFKSPSTASKIVLGASSNGWLDWKNKSGKTLKEVYLV